MKIGDWSATRSLSGLYREIRELGLETNLAELEAFGFTIIEDALDADLMPRANQLRPLDDHGGGVGPQAH